MMDKLVLVVVIAAFGVHIDAEQFLFQSAEYPIKETPGVDNQDTATVAISRTGTNAETNLQKTITISAECPDKVTATASSTDFTFDNSVSFSAGVLRATVDITIKDDEEDEFREFFCLTINEPGSQTSTIIYIPGNDYCVNIDTPAATNADATNVANAAVKYVGPWHMGDSGNHDAINIDIEPESGGGDDINIWLTQTASQESATLLNYYGILLDDQDASTHSGETNGDSVVIKNGVGSPAADNLVVNINEVSAQGAVQHVVTDAGVSFTLQFTENTGAIVLEDQSSNKLYTASDSDPSKVDVNHLFVSSGDSKYASWKVCGLFPRKLPTVAADATGYAGGRSPDKAIDGFRGPDFTAGGCFTSNSVTDPWLQIDLGKEYDVKLVLIYPMYDTSNVGTIQANSLDNADVYVGSCPSTSIATITSNNKCDIGIGTYTTAKVIEVLCLATSYGRYVYIHQDTTSNAQFSLCEVEVYGDDIPYGDEATIQFTAATFQTADDESAATVSITAERTGSSSLTCTTAEFYTDTVTLPGGSSDDFTAVLSTAPQTLSWDAEDETTEENTKTLSVTIENDATCEPPETFNVYLTNVNGGILGPHSCSTITIIDDDSLTYELSSPTFKVNEGSTVNIGVTRTGTGTMQQGSAGLTFTEVTAESEDYASAATTVDFTSSSSSPQYHVLSTVEDQEYEGDETLTVTLDQDNLEPSTCSSAGTQQTATVTITDDDSQFEWNVDGDSITIPEGTATTTLAISREGVAQQKTINIDVNNDDATSSDYSVSSSSVKFIANDDSQSVTVTVVDDSDAENDESFTLTLRDPLYTTGHKNLGDPYRITVTIQDNDAVYSWVQALYYAQESDGTVRVCLERQGDTSTTKTIRINSASGTAISGVDFQPLGQITFSGTSEACENVQITNDNTVDPTKVFTLTIASGQQDVALGTTITTTVEIADDDYSVTWETPFYSFEETSPVNYVTIVKTGTGIPRVTITSQPETAEQGIDYAAVSTTVTLSDPTTRIPITIYDNDEDEPSKTFTITISATGIISSTTRVTITDDDPPPTEPPPEGLSVGVIAGIIAAAVVGVIVIIIGVGIFFVAIGGKGASTAAAATAGAGAGSAAAKGIPLDNYQLGGMNSLGLYDGYGNGLSGQGFGNGLSNQGFGNGLTSQGFGNGLPVQGFGNGLSNQGFGGFNQQFGFA